MVINCKNGLLIGRISIIQNSLHTLYSRGTISLHGAIRIQSVILKDPRRRTTRAHIVLIIDAVIMTSLFYIRLVTALLKLYHLPFTKRNNSVEVYGRIASLLNTGHSVWANTRDPGLLTNTTCRGSDLQDALILQLPDYTYL